jgi:hypothetical protein
MTSRVEVLEDLATGSPMRKDEDIFCRRKRGDILHDMCNMRRRIAVFYYKLSSLGYTRDDQEFASAVAHLCLRLC